MNTMIKSLDCHVCVPDAYNEQTLYIVTNLVAWHDPVNDPFAVTFSFTDDKITWIFARDLLLHAMNNPGIRQGCGSVQCWTKEPYMYVVLESQNGKKQSAVLRLKLEQVTLFINETLKTIPVDYNYPQPYIDCSIDNLLLGKYRK